MLALDLQPKSEVKRTGAVIMHWFQHVETLLLSAKSAGHSHGEADWPRSQLTLNQAAMAKRKEVLVVTTCRLSQSKMYS